MRVPRNSRVALASAKMTASALAQVAMILRTGRVAEGFTCFIQRVLIHTTKARLRADWDVDAQAGGCRGGLLAEAALLALAVGAAMGHSGRI